MCKFPRIQLSRRSNLSDLQFRQRSCPASTGNCDLDGTRVNDRKNLVRVGTVLHRTLCDVWHHYYGPSVAPSVCTFGRSRIPTNCELGILRCPHILDLLPADSLYGFSCANPLRPSSLPLTEVDW
jgi:hypothetical protein